MTQGIDRRSSVVAALPSWYIDLTDERPQVVKRLQVPVISGTVHVRLQPRRPGQVLAAALVMLTYPLLLFVSVFSPLANLVRGTVRLFVRVFDLRLPIRGTPAGRGESVERVNQSIEQVGRVLTEALAVVDRKGSVVASRPTVPEMREPSDSRAD
nr:hypothetical protein [Micromonospora sp. DSM 115978]